MGISNQLARVAAVLAIAGVTFFQGAAFGGPLKKKSFSARELKGFEHLEKVSRGQTRDIKRSGGGGLITPGGVLAVAALAGIVVWAANSDEREDECIINGVKIDPNSKECKRAADLADSH